MGTLYVVATPIGNLDDITLRALHLLRVAPLIACEDTRTTRRLLERHGITGRLISFTDHNKRVRIPTLLTHLETADLALVSEAGTPAISDPGEDLVTAAIAAGHRVVPSPGASAVLAALVVSGLPARRFLYLGFLPRTATERRRLFASLRSLPYTLVAYESPHRVQAALADAAATLGDRRVAVCRELTKLHEEIWRGPLTDAPAQFGRPRGEFTLVIDGAGATAVEPAPAHDAALAEVEAAVRAGVSARDAVAAAARRHGAPRRQVYEAWLARCRAAGDAG
ncbi:MAG: 16S rRNA (cytidine(1402)-2'-O)-methyltransferase [Dehalococcoidia bacterium]